VTAERRDPTTGVVTTRATVEHAHARVVIEGEIDMFTARRAAAAIRAATRDEIRLWSSPAASEVYGLTGRGTPAVEVDLTGVTFMDVGGAKTLASAVDDARNHDVQVVVLRPLNTGGTHVLELIDFFDDSGSGGRRFRRRARDRGSSDGATGARRDGSS
jgi:STAS domain